MTRQPRKVGLSNRMVGEASHIKHNCPCCTYPGERYVLKRNTKAREKREVLMEIEDYLEEDCE